MKGVADAEARGAGGLGHGGGEVAAGDDRSGGGELLSEGAIAAAEVEDVLAGLRVQEFGDGGSEGGDEAAVGGVGGGVPGLGRWGASV